jgi:NADH dehydrogenase
VRQGKLLSKNLLATIRGDLPREYFHKNLGAVAGLGLGEGAFQSGKFAVTGIPAWFMHRGYHGLAMPMWERKIRVFNGWVLGALLRRDITSFEMRETPRATFAEFASRPKPPAAAAPAAAEKPARAPRAVKVPVEK